MWYGGENRPQGVPEEGNVHGNRDGGRDRNREADGDRGGDGNSDADTLTDDENGEEVGGEEEPGKLRSDTRGNGGGIEVNRKTRERG